MSLINKNYFTFFKFFPLENSTVTITINNLNSNIFHVHRVSLLHKRWKFVSIQSQQLFLGLTKKARKLKWFIAMRQNTFSCIKNECFHFTNSNQSSKKKKIIEKLNFIRALVPTARTGYAFSKSNFILTNQMKYVNTSTERILSISLLLSTVQKTGIVRSACMLFYSLPIATHKNRNCGKETRFLFVHSVIISWMEKSFSMSARTPDTGHTIERFYTTRSATVQPIIYRQRKNNFVALSDQVLVRLH